MPVIVSKLTEGFTPETTEEHRIWDPYGTIPDEDEEMEGLDDEIRSAGRSSEGLPSLTKWMKELAEDGVSYAGRGCIGCECLAIPENLEH
jgi:hypothetical protein